MMPRERHAGCGCPGARWAPSCGPLLHTLGTLLLLVQCLLSRLPKVVANAGILNV